MKILLISIGTRGDIEPFLAIAEMLQKKGHETFCCFPEQFRALTIEAKQDFIGLSAKFLELLDSKEGKIVMGGKASFFEKVNAYYRLYKESSVINKLLVKQQAAIIKKVQPDRVVFHIKAILPLFWGVENPEKAILVSPIPYLIHDTKNHGHIGFNKNYGALINKLTYTLTNFGLLKNVRAAIKELSAFKKITSKQLKETLLTSKIVFTVSPSLFSRPVHWPQNVQVLGYHERNKINSWNADEMLKAFIAQHDKILFVTFGSMTNENPEEKTAIILDIVQDYNIPTIINTSSGGLLNPKIYNRDLVHFVHDIPYDWIFQKIHATIHHGGSGTTHTALKYACSTLIIPHIMDQFMWNKLIHNLGVGPKGIAVKKMSRKNLEPKLLDLFQNNVYKERAKQVSEQIKNEKFDEKLCQFIL